MEENAWKRGAGVVVKKEVADQKPVSPPRGKKRKGSSPQQLAAAKRKCYTSRTLHLKFDMQDFECRILNLLPLNCEIVKCE